MFPVLPALCNTLLEGSAEMAQHTCMYMYMYIHNVSMLLLLHYIHVQVHVHVHAKLEFPCSSGGIEIPALSCIA